MPAFVTISVSDEQLATLQAALPPKQVRSALFQAVKRTTKTGATQVNRRVRAEINISKKYADRAIRVFDPKGDNPVGVISISRKPIPLIAYRPRVSKKAGVRATISKNKPPVVYRHAFKATVKTKGTDDQHEGHEGIFFRTRHLPTKGKNAGKGKLTPRGFAGRLAIKEAMGPSVLSVFGEAGTTRVASEELAKLHDVLQKNLDSQMDRFLNRRKGQANAAG
jgi:hypothetical protein